MQPARSPYPRFFEQRVNRLEISPKSKGSRCHCLKLATSNRLQSGSFSLSSRKPPWLIPYPEAIDFDRAPSRRHHDFSFTPVFGIPGPGLNPGEAQNKSHQESTQVREKRPCWRLLWKDVFPVFQRLHESPAAEPAITLVQQIQ